MSRRTKGPRLYLRAGRADRRTDAVWVIRDGQAEVSTGCGADGVDAAEQALAAYITKKWQPPAEIIRTGDPAGVLVAEVIALYAKEVAAKVPDPVSAKTRLTHLLTWWGDKTLADVKRSECNAYVKHRQTQPDARFNDPVMAPRVSAQTARRELEDLSSAIGHWHGEHRLTHRPDVALPAKPESKREALTRHQAARLLMAARGYRWTPESKTGWARVGGSVRQNRAHLRRFVLIGIYTGTRPGVIPKLLWHECPAQAWVGVDDGVIWRRGKDEHDHRTKRRPMVRMPRRLIAHMRRWKAIDDRTAALVDQGHHAAAKRRAKPDQRPATVLHHGGRPLAGRIRRGFASIVADAGLEGEITPHWMRHTCATWLMEAEVSIWDGAAFTGMTAATLEKCYGHHRPTHQQAARNAFSRS